MRVGRSTGRILATGVGVMLVASFVGAPVVPVGAVVAPPVNDTFAAATVVDTFPFYQTLDTSAATTNEAVDAEAAGLCGIGSTDATVWYSFTAPESRSFEVDVTASTYAAGIVVTTGAPGSLALVDCRPKSVAFDAVAGTLYHVLVYGTGSGGGSLHLAVGFAPPWVGDQSQERIDEMFGIQPNQDSARYNGGAQTVKPSQLHDQGPGHRDPRRWSGWEPPRDE
jgi:hypothetical protein